MGVLCFSFGGKEGVKGSFMLDLRPNSCEFITLYGTTPEITGIAALDAQINI